MTTKFDTICDLIAEQEFADGDKIVAMMKEYSETYHRTYHSLMRIPGFRKLWDAISEAAHLSARIEV